MRTEIKMPYLGEEIREIRLVRWLVEPGTEIEIDQDLAVMQVDGGDFVLPSPIDGRIVELCASPDDLITTEEVMAVVEEASGWEPAI